MSNDPVTSTSPLCAEVPCPPLARRHWVLPAAIALVHFLLLVAKPAHIDDTIYLETVKGILADPLRPLCKRRNLSRDTFRVTPVHAIGPDMSVRR